MSICKSEIGRFLKIHCTRTQTYIFRLTFETGIIFVKIIVYVELYRYLPKAVMETLMATYIIKSEHLSEWIVSKKPSELPLDVRIKSRSRSLKSESMRNVANSLTTT